MWLFLPSGFLSIVADRDNPQALLVRARMANHIHDLFPTAKVLETPDADYGFRTNLNHKIVEQVVSDQVSAIDYPNFKNNVSDPAYHAACLQVWSAMNRLQRGASYLW